MKQSSTSLREPAHSILSHATPPVFIDHTTKEKIERHLNDINDMITEEDIRNIDTNITLRKITSPISV